MHEPNLVFKYKRNTNISVRIPPQVNDSYNAKILCTHANSSNAEYLSAYIKYI
jgi:hypothetical protein